MIEKEGKMGEEMGGVEYIVGRGKVLRDGGKEEGGE